MAKEIKTSVMPEATAETVENETKALTLEERKAEIDGIIKTYNTAADNADLKAMQTNDALLQEAVAIYNKQLREAEYEKWLATDAVVLNALRQGNVEQMKIKRVQADENAPTHIELSTRNVLVDLVELNNFAGLSRKIFVSGQWIHKIESLTKTLTERICKDIENKALQKQVTETMELSAEAQQALNIKDRLSNTSLKAACQMICDDIVEGFTFTGKDLKYILLTMTRQSNKERATLVAPRKTTTIKLMTEALHRMVTAKEYGVEYKKAEK